MSLSFYYRMFVDIFTLFHYFFVKFSKIMWLFVIAE